MGISTGAAILGGALLGTAGAAYSANEASSAAQSAADAQAQATMYATDMQLEYLREVRADIADAVDKGLIDLEDGFALAREQLEPMTDLSALNTAYGLLEDPSSIADRASYQFQLSEGLDAMNAAYSKSVGGGVSGAALKAAQQYGQNLASLSLDDELNRLYPFINLASSARQQLSNLYATQGQSEANLRLGGATGSAQAVSNTIPQVAQGIIAQGNNTASSLLSSAASNINAMSNYTDIGSQLLSYFSSQSQPQLFSSVQPTNSGLSWYSSIGR